MEDIIKQAQGAYLSERLQYIRIDKDDENFKEYLKTGLDDPVNQVLGGTTMLFPRGASDIETVMGFYTSAILGVAICLPPSESGDESKKEKDDDAKKPIIIGDIIAGEDGVPDWLKHNRCCPIGVAIRKEYQNKGYGREAINWMLDWGFAHAGFHCMQIDTVSYNTRAIHLYEKMGFVADGRRRECVWFNRQWYDEVLFSMTEHEWEKIRGISKTLPLR
jgi:GNAT superfamily N-acetyltransferase